MTSHPASPGCCTGTTGRPGCWPKASGPRHGSSGWPTRRRMCSRRSRRCSSSRRARRSSSHCGTRAGCGRSGSLRPRSRRRATTGVGGLGDRAQGRAVRTVLPVGDAGVDALRRGADGRALPRGAMSPWRVRSASLTYSVESSPKSVKSAAASRSSAPVAALPPKVSSICVFSRAASATAHPSRLSRAGAGYIPHTVTGAPPSVRSRRNTLSRHGLPLVRSKMTRCPSAAAQRSR